jgi:hypothetical protein
MRLKTTSLTNIATGLELSGPLQTGMSVKTYHSVCILRLGNYTMQT